MAGTSGRRRWWIAAAAAIVAVTAIALGIAFWPTATPPTRAHRTTAAAPIAPPPPVSTPAPAPTSSAPVRPVARIRHVAAAAPTGFTFTGPEFTIKAHVCGMADIRPLDPPGEQHHTVCWVDEGFGVAPGSDTATTYVLGHSWAENRLEVLNRASTIATKQIIAEKPTMLAGVPIYPVTRLNGYTMILDTAKGRLTYTVRRVYGVAKDQAGDVRRLMNESTMHRVALITCAERKGVDYDYDVIVEAFLTAAAPARA
jgi:hypothetical protein